MRKADIETSYHQGTSGLPMVNVKVDAYDWSDYADKANLDLRLPGYDAAWIMGQPDADKLGEWAWEAATEQGWEQLENDAREIFATGYGPKIQVESAGRSGGWCVVRGLPDVETWDAVMVAKWSKFCRWAKQIVDGVPYDMAWYVGANVYEGRLRDAGEVVKALSDGMALVQ